MRDITSFKKQAFMSVFTLSMVIVSLSIFNGKSMAGVKPERIVGDPCSANETAHKYKVDLMYFDPDGKFFISNSGFDWKIWEIPSGKLLSTFKGGGGVHQFIPHNGGYLLATAGHKGIDLREIPSGRKIKKFELEGFKEELKLRRRTSALALNYSGDILATGWEEGIIDIWEIHTGKLAVRIYAHLKEVRRIFFSPDGKYLVSTSEAADRKIWKFPEMTTYKEYNDFGTLTQVAFSPDGKLLFEISHNSEDEVKIIELDSGKLIGTLKYIKGKFTNLTLNNAGSLLATGFWSKTKGKSHAVLIWDLRSMKLISSTKIDNPYFKVSISPNGRHITINTGDGRIKVIKMDSGECVGLLVDLHDKKVKTYSPNTIWVPVFR